MIKVCAVVQALSHHMEKTEVGLRRPLLLRNNIKVPVRRNTASDTSELKSIACCSGVGAAQHQGTPAYLIKCSGSCLYNYTGLFCLVKINADILSFIVSC